VVRSKSRPEKSKDILKSRFPTKASACPTAFDLDKPSASLGFKVIVGMVRQMQGHLTFASNDPMGTRFVLDLPILPEA
jgi:K+-sensing histidine kinase KdpD